MGKWTRRAFIGTGILAGGTLVVGVAIRPGNRAEKVTDFMAEQGEAMMNIWLKISPDNTVTAIIPHAEMGQGVLTALGMMLADELEADWQKVRLEEAPAHKEYANYAMAKGFVAGGINFPQFMVGTIDGLALTASKAINLQVTGGSASVRFTGMDALRLAGASAKSMLLEAASQEWDTPVEQLFAKESYIHAKDSNRKAPFADFALKAAELSAPSNPKLKTPAEFKLMGTSPARIDIPAKVDGTAQFGLDIELPGMKYASVKAAPVFGSKVKAVDATAVQTMPGVRKVVQLERAVAVIADSFWQAKQALMKLPVEFESSSHDSVNQVGIFAQYSQDLDAAISNDSLEEDYAQGNHERALEGADKIIKAEYRIPYLAHATMEPQNCTVWLHDGQCEVWTGTQNPLGLADALAKQLELDLEQVKVHNQLLGGGFGRRSETDVPIQAVRIAQEVDYPVKLIWTREEDTQQDVYREANISRFQAALDATGKPLAWVNRYLFKHHPPEASQAPYQIENQAVSYTTSNTHVPWGNWRSVDHSMHGFFIESFIDELAYAAGSDPYQYRRNLLEHDEQWLKVLDTAAEKANWNETLPANWGRGIAIHKSFGTIVAEVAEVEIKKDGGLRVHRVVCAADPGMAIHPDGFIAQMESGIVYGLTAALYGEISIENGAVKQSNFHDYQMLRMDECPVIETHIINSGKKVGGAGEPSTPVIAPALANAIFAATGRRIRELPIKNHDLSRSEKIELI